MKFSTINDLRTYITGMAGNLVPLEIHEMMATDLWANGIRDSIHLDDVDLTDLAIKHGA